MSEVESQSETNTEISRELMREHQLILRVVAAIDKLAGSQLSDETLFKIAPQLVAFIREFADHYHHEKEEKILFEFLNQPGVLSHCNPVGQMLYEHDLGRQAVSRMLSAIDAKDRQQLITAALDWAQLLNQHIYKEDNILYPMAEQGLSPEQKAQINERYLKVEQSLQADNLWQTHQYFVEQLEELVGQ